MSAVDADTACTTCGHLYDEHTGMRDACAADVQQHEATRTCWCPEFINGIKRT